MDSIPFPSIQFQEIDRKELPSPVVTKANGRYELILLAGKAYCVTYGAEGYITRSLEIDLGSTPPGFWSRGVAMNIDLTLPKELPGLDVTLFTLPAGKARYDPKISGIGWDVEYTQGIAQRIDSLFQDYSRRQVMH